MDSFSRRRLKIYLVVPLRLFSYCSVLLHCLAFAYLALPPPASWLLFLPALYPPASLSSVGDASPAVNLPAVCCHGQGHMVEQLRLRLSYMPVDMVKEWTSSNIKLPPASGEPKQKVLLPKYMEHFWAFPPHTVLTCSVYMPDSSDPSWVLIPWNWLLGPFPEKSYLCGTSHSP